MKIIEYIGIGLILGAILTSCKKGPVIAPLASLNVINASAAVPSVAVNFTAPPIPFYLNQALISYGSSLEYGIPSGVTPYSLVSSADTTRAALKGSLNLKAGKIYSLYISGVLPNIDTLFIQDQLPTHPDSTAGVRFINLAPDIGLVSINLQGITSTEFSSIGYKKIAPFKSYAVTTTTINSGGYNFEIRDSAGNLIASFDLSNNLFPFRNYTLVISGYSSTGYQVFQVNNF